MPLAGILDEVAAKKGGIVSETPAPQVADLAHVIATYGLPVSVLPGGPQVSQMLPQPLNTLQFLKLLDAATRERLLGLLAACASTNAGSFTADQHSLISTACHTQLSVHRMLNNLAVTTARMFERDGLEVRVLKGAAHAHLEYADPELRHYIDVDLLVRGSDLDRACALLLQAGNARRGFPDRVPGFEGRFGKGIGFITTSGAGIDVHRTLAQPPFGLNVREADLFAKPRPFSLADTTLLAMSRSARFLHACLHAGVGDYVPRTVPLLDVLRMAAAPDLDHAHVLNTAAEWRITAVVQRAFKAAVERLPGTVVPTWAEGLMSYEPSDWERRAMALALAHRPPGLELLPAVWMSLTEPRDRARLAVAMVLPSRTYLSGRYRGYLDYWRSQYLRMPIATGERRPRAEPQPPDSVGQPGQPV
jgi:hypothetical protein